MRRLLPLLLILATLINPVLAQCDASFSFSVNGATVNFSADSTWPGMQHKWRLGDGHIAFGPSTSHTYNASGLYSVWHIVVDSLGQCSDSVVKQVNISFQASCQASFVYSRDSVLPNKYYFNSTSTASGGSIDSYRWTLDGNTVSTSPSFTISPTQGLHQICLSITTTAGCSSTTCDSIVADSVGNCDLNAGFDTLVTGDTVAVEALSTGASLAHFWKFGDGHTAYGPHAHHVYGYAGTFTITHYITDSSSNCVDSAKNTVVINEPVSCQALFWKKADSLVANQYHFYSQSIATGGAIQSYSWTVNGDARWSGQNFTHTFSPGKHQVCLSITTAAGCMSTFCDSVTIGDGSVDTCDVNPGFTATIYGDSLFLAAHDRRPHIVHSWHIPGGITLTGATVRYIYNNPQIDSIAHFATDTIVGCTAWTNQGEWIVLGAQCSADFVIRPDSPQQRKYTFVAAPGAPGGTVTGYTWTLDGHFISNNSSFSKHLNAGVHAVCLVITASTGCTDTVCKNITVDSVQTVGVSLVPSYPNPVPGGVLNLQLKLENQQKVKITVYNARGVAVLVQERNYSQGYNRIAIPVDALQRGQYFIDIQYGNTRKRSVFQKL